MIAALLLAQALAATTPAPPADLTGLPNLRFVGAAPVQDANAALFVRDEVAAGRCAAAIHGPEGYSLKVSMAVFADAKGRALQVVPVAIGCSTVEQYAAGFMSRVARSNIDVTDTTGHGWYRTTLAFAWTG